MTPKLNVHPEYPPRARVEWLIAGTRVVLAAGALLVLAVDATTPSHESPVALPLLSSYLLYSIGVLAIVWTPVRFTPGWGVAVHLSDLTAFAAAMVFAGGPTSPLLVYFVFLVISSTLRWQLRGALWTAAGTIAVYGVLTLHGVALNDARYGLTQFLVRSFQLALMAALLGYLGAYQQRFEREITQAASWPRRIPRNSRDVVGEIVAESGAMLEAPRILVIWEEPGEGQVNVASHSGADLVWTSESEAAYGSLVVPSLEHKSFLANNVENDRGRVVYRSSGRFLVRRCRPIKEPLRARFAMRAVQSWSLEGEIVRGRLFCLDKTRMRVDDLIVGELVARLAASRLDGLYLLGQLRRAAAMEERLRVARDLHDSLLQSLAGTALQVVAARRLLDRDPSRAKDRLEDVQRQLEESELEMRSFIQRLRPPNGASSTTLRMGLSDRLDELRRRVESQWEVRIRARSNLSEGDLPPMLVDEVYRIVQEGVLNAARHADASIVTVDLSVSDNKLQIGIVDDGSGFPFHGTYDLAALAALNRGPLTLRERVAELHGDLSLRSTEAGTELLITVPVTRLAG